MFISPIGAVTNTATKVSGVRKNNLQQTVSSPVSEPDKVSFRGGNYAEVFNMHFAKQCDSLYHARKAFNDLIAALNKRKLFYGHQELSTGQLKAFFDRLTDCDPINLDGTLGGLALGMKEEAAAANAAKKINSVVPHFFLTVIKADEEKYSKALFGVQNHGRFRDKTIFDRKIDDVGLIFLDEKESYCDWCDDWKRRIINFSFDSDQHIQVSKGYYPNILTSYERFFKDEQGGKIKDRAVAQGDEFVITQFKSDGSIDDGSDYTLGDAAKDILKGGFRSAVNSITDLLGL